MNRVLIISSSLRIACKFVDPFAHKLETFLSKKCYVEFKSAYGLDVSIINDYDILVFAFANASNMIPSSTLEIFDDISHLTNSSQKVYTLICNDEYETDKCDYSERVVEIFCEKMSFEYKGSLKIGACFIINHIQYKFVLTNHIKQFSQAIIENKDISLEYSYTSKSHFMKNANRYWKKLIIKEEQ